MSYGHATQLEFIFCHKIKRVWKPETKSYLSFVDNFSK